MKELHEFCLSMCLQLILKRNTNPLKCIDIFYLPVTRYRYYNPGGYMKIRHEKKRSGSHFNDTNSRFYVCKRDLKVILMTRTEVTTCKKAIQKSFLWYELKIPRTKMRSGSHFNDANSRFHVRTRDLKVILMTRTEDMTYKKAIQKSFLWYELKIPCTKMRSRSHFNDTNGIYHVRISYLEVISLLRNEDTMCEKWRKKSYFNDIYQLKIRRTK